MDQSFVSQVVIRPGKDTDRNFIINSWIKTCRHSPMFRECPDRIYYQKMTDIIDGLLMTKSTAILAPSEYPDQILAWLAYERIEDPGINTVYFAYTKKPYRELGAQRFLFGQLLGDDPIQFAIPTSIGRKISRNLSAIYNPFIILR